MKTQKSQQPRAELRVQSAEGGRWTWCYVEPDVELFSNETYATADDARRLARRAYPDVAFAEGTKEP